MWLRECLVRLLPWGRRDRVDREVSRELTLHLELETRRNIEQGMSPEDAMRAARAALGNVPLIREDVPRRLALALARCAAAEPRAPAPVAAANARVQFRGRSACWRSA